MYYVAKLCSIGRNKYTISYQSRISRVSRKIYAVWETKANLDRNTDVYMDVYRW